MAINAKNFTFCNKDLWDFGFVIANFDTASDDNVSCGNIELVTARPPLSTKNIIHGVSYGEPITLVFQIIKFDFATSTCSKTPVTNTEYEELMRWLVRTNYNYLNFDNGDVYFNVTMNVVAKKIGGDIYGFEITATNDSVYSYSEEYTKPFYPGHTTFVDNSSVVGYMYPQKLEITVLNDGDVVVEVTDDKSMKILNCSRDEVLTVDCEHGVIETSLPNHDISRDFNFEFLRFHNTYESRDNDLFIVNAEAKITYRYTRMVVI